MMQKTQDQPLTASPYAGNQREGTTPESKFRWAAFLAVCVVLAAALRFSFPTDIEYKADEQYTYDALNRYRAGGGIPLLGMGSSVGVRNPGFSVWIFLALGELSGAHNPVQLARSVAALNMIALLVLIFASRTVVPKPDRDAWSWAAAFLAVNPLAVLFARKIWPPSTLLLFSVLLLLAWFYHDRRAGAFCWGLLSAILGQIQLAGFFFAGGFWLWAALFERRQSHPRLTKWHWALAGAALGAVPLIPWLRHISSTGPRSPEWLNLLSFTYWFNWINTAVGLSMWYSLGANLKEFLQAPVLYGHTTYIVLALHAGILAAAAYLIASSGALFNFTSWDRILGTKTDTTFVLSAAWWGMGLMMTACALPIFMHYIVVAYPLPWLWLAQGAEARRGKKALAFIWCLQLLISVSFLYYIHVHHGAPGGDYGIAYGYQAAAPQ